MKQIIRNLWLLLCGVGLLTAVSCSDEGEEPVVHSLAAANADFAPLVISVTVLSPLGYSNLPYADLSGVYAEYHGQKFFCNVPPQDSRVIQPKFYGLKSQNDYLLFGEFEGKNYYENEQIIINWGLESIKPDTITFTYKLQGDGKAQTDYWINGYAVKHINKEGYITVTPCNNTKDAADYGSLILYKDLTPLTEPKLKYTQQISLTESEKDMKTPFNIYLTNVLHNSLTSGEKSMLTSPLSVAYLLAMMACGTGANTPELTTTQISEALCGAPYTKIKNSYIDGPTFMTHPLNTLLKAIVEQAPKCDPDVKLYIANALFARQGFPLYSGFVNYIAETYHADYARLDFDSPTALQAINNWSNTKTCGMIQKILDEINPNAVAYALNATYFSAPWALPFDKELTQDETFTRTDGSTSKVPMMHKTLVCGYYDSKHFEFVALPFANGAFNMMIVLPKEGETLSSLTDNKNYWGVGLILMMSTIVGNSQKALVDLSLPRFSIETSNNDLKDQLKQLGVTSLFDPEKANLTEISPKPIYVSDMIQKARIRVDEAGCEAAATTAIEFSSGMQDYVTFRADRPFLYFITERSTGLMFFAGAYCGD